MPSSSVPIVRIHAPDDMVLAIEVLRDRAETDGNGTLAYLLDMAKLEAERISAQARRDEAERRARPDDLWRPS
ncbi:hypothetical protein [Enterovirga sp. CN4-39]|uniref:hypothetical protein n=1 Tax=Enterovirga sp. CN4-39 TaxID=3400910 RepID=UPI003C08795E